MVAPYVPAVVELRVHEAATVAFAVILTGAGHVTVNPVAGLVTGVRVTVPAKLNVLVRETDIAAPVAPELKLTGEPDRKSVVQAKSVDLAERLIIKKKPEP